MSIDDLHGALMALEGARARAAGAARHFAVGLTEDASVVPTGPGERSPDGVALNEAVALLANKFDGTGSRPRPTATLDDAVRALPPMPPLGDYASAVEEVERLERLSDPRTLDRWRLIRHLDAQRRLLEYVVARSRRAEDAPCVAGGGALRTRVTNVLQRLRMFSKEARPGWVNGLQQTHTPTTGATWDAEAALLLAQLRPGTAPSETSPPSGPNPERALADLRAALAANVAQVPARVDDCLGAGVSIDDPRLLRLLHGRDVCLTGKRFKRLRKELRGFANRDGEGDGDEETIGGPVPRDWVFRSVTDGKRAVLLGGDQRAAANGALEEAFGFESLEWLDGLKHHQVAALAERIRNGRYDLVILLARFASHSIQNVVSPACAAAGVLWVVVSRGYGATAVMRAIEAAQGVRVGRLAGPMTHADLQASDLRGM